MNTTTDAVAPARRTGLNVALWIAQVLLAGMFLYAGFLKLTQPIDALAPTMAWTTAIPEWLVRFIGAAELAAAVGLILPSVTRIKPGLTVLAALGLVLVMLLAAGFHAMRGEIELLPINLVIGLVAAFIAWGRSRAAPIAPRRS